MKDAFGLTAQFLLTDAQRNSGLPAFDMVLAKLGCRLALPLDREPLADDLRYALADGIAIEVIEAAFLHAIGYLGLVRITPAYRVFSDLAGHGRPAGSSNPEIAATHDERVTIGAALYDRFDPGRAVEQGKLFADLSPTYYPMAMEFAGVTLAHPAINARQRQVMTLAMLSCLGGQPAQLTFHAGVALDRGVSPAELGAILVTVQAYAGLPRANAAALLIRDVILTRKK